MMITRPAKDTDIPQLKSLYYNTILSINAQHYNEVQISAWASTADNITALRKRIKEQFFMVAENEEGVITGFASLDDQTGYLDLLYVHKDYQRKDVASILLQSLLGRANQLGIEEITTDASITARPFFEKNGFELIKQQTVEVKGVQMINFKMKYKLIK